jgi:hypothetical protein
VRANATKKVWKLSGVRRRELADLFRSLASSFGRRPCVEELDETIKSRPAGFGGGA